jgi:glycine cleavage system H protein
MPSPADRLYSDSHEWHRVEGETLTLGLTRYAVDALTDVTYVTVKPVGTKVEAGKPLGEVESVKTSSDIYCAAGGEVVEVNAAVVADPGLLNKDPYQHWLVKLRISDRSGLARLLTSADYDAKYPTG